MSASESLPFAYERPEAAAEAREKTIDERFAKFHAANPGVFAELLKLARDLHAKRAGKIGIRMLWEVMRWQRLMATSTVAIDDFRLNDHYTSRYARLLMESEPALAGCFELRELRA